MDGVLVVAWSILGGLWLVTAPGVLVAFGAVGDPPAEFRAGWVVGFLGWLSIPLTVILALLGGGPWLPLTALPVGHLVGRVGVRLARRGAP